ncbi:interferon-related developmental regulator 1 [Spea bombifrons]|uniref:interferon-related developmental regulator 1 n=1 Tax=Spea bombifrons TaxID=233779 RepID=UPI0023494211|nr:interferon-related developmental regulator 1 [Spea bombifrons]
MPKSKKRNSRPAGGRSRNVQPFSDDDSSVETMSHCSSFSDATSFAEDGGEVDEDAAQEDFEYKLKGLIDLTMDKSAKTRQAALEGLKTGLSSKLVYDFILERRLTLTDCIERCLKKGKTEEQRVAAAVACLLCCQLGSGMESEEVFRSLAPVLRTIICDRSAAIQARQACATYLGLCCFIASDDIEDLYTTMECLENVFTKQYHSEGGSDCSALHIQALLSWALLLTICHTSEVKKKLDIHMHKIPRLLSCDDVNMRIAAGETLALLFELARDAESDFYYEDLEPLTQTLKALATDCNKHRAKVDRRKQRSVFRDVLRAVEEGDFQSETIRFGRERMHIDCWVKRLTYGVLKELFGSGMQYHLLTNVFLRSIFELGPPLLLDTATIKSMKMSRGERHMNNSAAFKARTKARSKLRDKRADVGEFF